MVIFVGINYLMISVGIASRLELRVGNASLVSAHGSPA